MSVTAMTHGQAATPSGFAAYLGVDLGIGHSVDHRIAVVIVMCMQGVRPGN